MPCPAGQSVCSNLGDTGGGLVGSVASSGFDHVAQEAMKSFAKVVEWMFTVWLHVGVPVQSGPGTALDWAQSQLSWVIGAAGVLSLLIGGARIALAGEKAAGDVARGMVMLVATTSLVVPAVVMLSSAGDMWAMALMRSVETDDVGRGLVTGIAAFGSVPAFFLALIGIISGFLQVFLILIRAAMLVLVTATVPVFGAASTTKSGYASLQRMIGWLIAALAYKPTAALVYAVGFKLVAGHTDPGAGAGAAAGQQLIGLVVIIMAVLVLPALMKVCVPLVGRVTSGANGGTVVAAAAGAAATGAVALASRSGEESGGQGPSRDDQSGQVEPAGGPPGPGGPSGSGDSGTAGDPGGGGSDGPDSPGNTGATGRAGSSGSNGAGGADGVSGSGSAGAAGSAGGSGAAGASGAGASGGAAAAAGPAAVAVVAAERAAAVGGAAVGEAQRAMREPAGDDE